MCKTYNRYMMYKLNEFRAKTREAFNKAEAGEEVLIDRHGVVFELSLYYEDEYTLDDLRSRKLREDLRAMSGVDDVFKGQSDSGLGTDLHPTTAARINPCRNPEPHIVGSLPCCAGIIFRPEPVVEPVDE